MAKRRRKRGRARRSDGGRLGAMLFGLVAGLGIAATAWWLLTPSAQRPSLPQAASAEKPEQRAAGPEPAAIEPSGKGYDFYEMLPAQEVIIADEAAAPRAAADGKVASRDALDEPGLYMLQAGSFRNADGAERIKAELALQGIIARVRPVKTADGTLHQVRVGPIDQDTANDFLRRVAAAGIDVDVFRAQP